MSEFSAPQQSASGHRFSVEAMRDYQRQRQMTLGDLLLENRVIFLQGEIYDGNANELVMKLLYLQSENRRKDIHFYINSPGGSVTSTMAIYDTMQMISCPVSTYCVGLAASGGAVLLAGGENADELVSRSNEKPIVDCGIDVIGGSKQSTVGSIDSAAMNRERVGNLLPACDLFDGCGSLARLRHVVVQLRPRLESRA